MDLSTVWRSTLSALSLAILTGSGSAQGLVPNGGFEQGTGGWNSIRFDDPSGSVGVGRADVTGNGPSSALFANFVSPTRRTHADWLSDPFLLPDGRWPVRFSVMWEKTAPVQIPDPSSNWIELHLLDPRGRIVFTGHIPVPRQSNLLERRWFAGEVIVPVPGHYKAMISMQHSELSRMAFKLWIDEVVVGDPSWSLLGDGCAGAGGFVPMISARGAPTIGMRSWSVLLSRANAPSTAWLAIGASTNSWFGTPLPFDAGGGCLLRIGILDAFGAPVSGTGPGAGTAQYPIPLLPDPALRGAVLHLQWLVLDAGSGSPFGLTLTPAMTATVQ